ncbi:Putative glycogen debranching enzyme [Methanocella conradii HZ254]|uniref:Glycogen debranching enzyme n=1 Tax=Methanocella conradii (strain DSM 24694 / JCM 17849 / CGMCC 1.5162 / HZ254) TaxID=1041930 RepID=H8I748_METCZ|nr:amylo-alpha-1,6-glucosidase [Methanocella conradii]AFD00299.1 Putative glycogen debranching enzyme [Methanocella conradii HZ254]
MLHKPPMTERDKIHETHTQVKDILGAMVIRDGPLTLVTMRNGDIPSEDNHGYGLYHRDCRFLSGYTLKCNGKTPTDILSSDEKGHASITMLTNQRYVDPAGNFVNKDTLSIRRDRIIPGVLDERITITNYNDFETMVTLSLEFDSDFDDIFTVRGITGPTNGKLLPPAYERNVLTLEYIGEDGHHRRTRIAFDPQPVRVEEGMATFNIRVKPREPQAIHVRIYAEDSPIDPPSMPGPAEIERRIKGIKASYADTMECCSNIQTDNGIFNKVFLRSLSDLRMLYSGLPIDIYYSAGVPWYDALFGRDSIISAIQVMPYNPEVARSTLRVLAAYQGKKEDDWRDERPGKILHELRVGEQANLNRIPDTPYYGSVDSTPLFLILMAEYIDWTGDMALFHELLGSVEAALRWIDTYGDLDGSGFTSYTCYSPKGLYNQCWKDSWDSICHSDGAIAIHPIAAAEVQGYVYMAKRRIANLYERIGRHEEAERLRRDAMSLRWKFNDRFWMGDVRYFAEALDKEGRCNVVSSNPAQALWGEIVEPEKAKAVVDRIFEEDMFSGWGIRTLSAREKRYNPLGYHTGTIWPHDNSLIAMGLNRYGFKDELSVIFTSMYEAAAFYPNYRLPELFGGFQRGEYDVPIKYPVACSPQAWSAGAIPYMLSATLGFIPDALNRRLTLYKPKLPPWLSTVRIGKLIVGEAYTHLEFKRVGDSTLVNVVGKRGDLEVHVVY